MRNLNFSDVLDSVCRSAGIDPETLAPKPAHRFFRSTASRLHAIASRVAELAARAQASANAFDPYLDELREAPARRMRKPRDPEAIAAELRIRPDMTLTELSRLRREFALSNHPDRVDPLERDVATHRMMIANMLIDRELKRRHTPRKPKC